MRQMCSKRGKGGSVIRSVRPGTETYCDTMTVRCSHCGEMLWRANTSSTEAVGASEAKVLRGKRILRFEETEESAESTQAFVVGDTRRKESLDGRERKERRCLAGVEGK